ncbi:neuronal acetylcholine receptor subunit beta-2-like [Ostrea edulis]|uniref:neuronal acetylcholine receptor subunit beta-2-like n=1 Tax=Ostrea edulis TaxID=37623 RepID=UPI002095F971|nr:neuronal acetylcholine receptor subunit beta-2-like [Ostrea edulis]
MNIYLVFLYFSPALAQTGTNMKDLYTYLLSPFNYNKDIRPARNQTISTQVGVQLLLTGLHHIDETHQKMVSAGTLTIRWTDEYLTWNPSSFGGANFIDVPQGMIWKPHLQVRNGMNDFHELGGNFMFLRIFSTGDVVWSPHKLFETKCRIDIAFFPFDQQTCSVELVSWTRDISNSVDGFRISELIHGHWSVSSHSVTTYIDSNDSVMSFNITLDRKPKIYILFIIIPIGFLIILDLLTFLLPNDCGEKVSYSITVLLALSIFLTIVASMLPANSDSISYLEVCIVVVIGQGVLILIGTAISLRIHDWKDDEIVPWCVQSFTRLSWKLQCKYKKIRNSNVKYSESKTKVETLESKAEEKELQSEEADVRPVNWIDVTYALDFYMFWTFSVVMVIVTVITLGLYLSK